jgi:ergothioneine biosynthesis protein EgtB
MSEDMRTQLQARYRRVRDTTEALAEPLSAEDQLLQSMPDASPTKWHRAHTSWFFDTFVLAPRQREVGPQFAEIFNSYYEAVGPRHPRPRRGLLSRPSAREVSDYRRDVDVRMLDLIADADDAGIAQLAPLIDLGLAHEEQHQELILTDILHAFAQNPLQPRYRDSAPSLPQPKAPHTLRWIEHGGGLVEVGASDDGFAFDNERPRHRVWVEPFALASRLATIGELKAFVAEGGYDTPALWLSEGLDFIRTHDIRAPLYTHFEDGACLLFGLDGMREAQDDEPITHVSFYEADAIARFLGGELATEHEWELAASAAATVDGNFRESGALRALPAPAGAEGPTQLFGDAWEWTRSAYAPYPGFRPVTGAIGEYNGKFMGEYNGKFMVNQMVLRGGSCFTPRGHVRVTYRNFWHPHARFQAAGVRVKKPLSRG